MEKRTDGKHWRAQNNGGYTLVELAVVIVILTVISGGLIFGVSGWMRRAEFKRQNSCAQLIFSAMQNQLTGYSQNGRLEELLAAVEQGGDGCIYPRAVEELTDADGQSYTAQNVWVHSGADGRSQSELASVLLTPEDYQAYCAGKDSGIEAAVYAMLDDYLYDDTLLDADICIDFTPAQGQVFAVLYSDCGGDVSGGDRSVKRRFHTVGYYGVDTLSAEPKEQPDARTAKAEPSAGAQAAEEAFPAGVQPKEQPTGADGGEEGSAG